jgi:nucleotidyltransferase substrate binding protein (TIGR01987 family)
MKSKNLSQTSSFINYRRALANLERSLATPITEPRDQSGIIKDFEMTYELSWKVLKKILLEQGHESLGAKDVFTKAYQLGFIKQHAPWLEMIEDRNLTSDVYDENSAAAIIDRIGEKYLSAFRMLRDQFTQPSA